MLKLNLLISILIGITLGGTLNAHAESLSPSHLHARRQSLPSLLKQAETLLLQGQIEQAIGLYQEAEISSPDRQLPALSWNSLCWYGSLWGEARRILDACDKAIELQPGAGEFRDSRGLARALTGDISGAIEDFQVFVNTTKDIDRKIERQGWINLLRQGKNPFTPQQLRLLFRD